MKFDYFKFPLDEKSTISERKSHLRPVIPLQIKAENGLQIGYYVLIDSGADFCIFHGEIGEAIGIDVKSGPKTSFGGVQASNKQCVGYAHSVCLVVGGHEIPSRVCFSYDIDQRNGYAIVGQHGFFDSFKVRFELLKERVELDPI